MTPARPGLAVVVRRDIGPRPGCRVVPVGVPTNVSRTRVVVGVPRHVLHVRRQRSDATPSPRPTHVPDRGPCDLRYATPDSTPLRRDPDR